MFGGGLLLLQSGGRRSNDGQVRLLLKDVGSRLAADFEASPGQFELFGLARNDVPRRDDLVGHGR